MPGQLPVILPDGAVDGVVVDGAVAPGVVAVDGAVVLVEGVVAVDVEVVAAA